MSRWVGKCLARWEQSFECRLRSKIVSTAGAEPVEQYRLCGREQGRQQVPGPPSSSWRRSRRAEKAQASSSTWPLGDGGGCCRDAGRDHPRLQGIRRRHDPLPTEAEQAAQAACETLLEAGTASIGASSDASGHSHGSAPCSYAVCIVYAPIVPATPLPMQSLSFAPLV